MAGSKEKLALLRRPSTLLQRIYKGVEINSKLIEQSTLSIFLGHKNIKHYDLLPGNLVHSKEYFHRDSLRPCWKGPYWALVIKIPASQS